MKRIFIDASKTKLECDLAITPISKKLRFPDWLKISIWEEKKRYPSVIFIEKDEAVEFVKELQLLIEKMH